MKRILSFAAAALLMPAAALAQGDAPVANPVTSTLRQRLTGYTRNMVGAAESMPADKYTFHPTPEQMTYAHLIAHIATSNTFLCSAISGTPEPEGAKPEDTDSKEKLVAAIKASFDYCAKALEKTDDSKLGEQVKLFGGRQAPRASAMITLAIDWADHYAAQAIYLRLNGILPPSAQPRRQ